MGMNKCCLLLSLQTIAAMAFAEYRSVDPGKPPFEMKPIPEYIFPGRDFSVIDYGAVAGGAKCTEAFARAVAGRIWGVPVIDLYAESGPFPLTKSHQRFFADHDRDMLHPNSRGHERISRTILGRMLTLPPNFKRDDGLFF